jgi:hypothetical protein
VSVAECYDSADLPIPKQGRSVAAGVSFSDVVIPTPRSDLHYYYRVIEDGLIVYSPFGSTVFRRSLSANAYILCGYPNIGNQNLVPYGYQYVEVSIVVQYHMEYGFAPDDYDDHHFSWVGLINTGCDSKGMPIHTINPSSDFLTSGTVAYPTPRVLPNGFLSEYLLRFKKFEAGQYNGPFFYPYADIVPEFSISIA